REFTYNVISLEISGTKLADQVRAPALVREVDMAAHWPDERKQREAIFSTKFGKTLFSFENKYPRVEHYCLMSASSSYTGFHIDFTGSSVWYHVLRGTKVFFLVEPTAANITAYEKYLDKKDTRFFGVIVTKCSRVTVNQGETLLIPAGWIHSVYTPEDSLVFGGNFIHARSIRMQQTITAHEEKLKLKKHLKYPQVDAVAFFYVDNLVKKVTGRHHIRPVSKDQQHRSWQYVGDDFIKLKGHHRIPDEKDKKWTWVWRKGEGLRKVRVTSHQQIKESHEYDLVKHAFAEFENVYLKNVDVKNFHLKDHPHIFYHPESFEVEYDLEETEHPCGLPLPENLPDIVIDDGVLRSTVHPSEIVELTHLLKKLLEKEDIDLPAGLTRPNSLLFCLE
ncbi:hypothetical protein PENTCL1PPCAC_30111, partial [Pristionchus entomophagus]